MDRAAAEDWIRDHVEPVGAIETAHERPWATVLRVPLGDGPAWFKACGPVQAFEPRLTAGLFARWPDRVAEVLAHDEQRGPGFCSPTPGCRSACSATAGGVATRGSRSSCGARLLRLDANPPGS